MRRTADQRLQRLLAVVPWVAGRDGPRLEEVCARFDCTEEELLDDLGQLFLCGLHPYTPDVLIEVDIADGRVWIRYADYFSRPLRLSPSEALALLAAGQALAAGPGTDPDGPLARALEKLGRTLGTDGGEALEISLGGVADHVRGVVDEGVAAHRRLEIEYYAFGRDEWSWRKVDPLAVFSTGGQWYLSAHCHRVDDGRLFRMDRVRSARLLDETFDPPAGLPDLSVYRPRPEDPRITLDLAPGARWVVEQYPTEAVEDLPGGGLRVTLAVSQRAWVERLLLRLGPAARPVGDDPSATLAADAAARVLGRYRKPSGTLGGS